MRLRKQALGTRNLVGARVAVSYTHLDVYKRQILLMLGGLFCLIEKSGGLSGFTTLMVEKGKLIHSKKGAALFTWLVGVLIFIDGTLSVCLLYTSLLARFRFIRLLQWRASG